MVKPKSSPTVFLETAGGGVIPLHLVVRTDPSVRKELTDKFKLVVKLHRITEGEKNGRSVVIFHWDVGIPLPPDPYLSITVKPSIYVQRKVKSTTPPTEKGLHLLLEELLYVTSWSFEVEGEKVSVSVTKGVGRFTSRDIGLQVEPLCITAFPEFYDEFTRELNEVFTELLNEISNEFVVTSIGESETKEATVSVTVKASYLPPIFRSSFFDIVGSMEIYAFRDELDADKVNTYTSERFLSFYLITATKLMEILMEKGIPSFVFSSLEDYIHVEIPEDLQGKLKGMKGEKTLRR